MYAVNARHDDLGANDVAAQVLRPRIAGSDTKLISTRVFQRNFEEEQRRERE